MAADRLEKLRAQRDALAARIRREESRSRTQQRRDDTRRKILAGAAVLDEAEQKPEFNAQLIKLLGRFLSRPDDRTLFGLPPLPPEKPEPTSADGSAELSAAMPPVAVAASADRMPG